MAYYLVHYLHTDMPRWQEFQIAHVVYLKDQIAAGNLIMSGPLVDVKENTAEAQLVFKVENRDVLQKLIEQDPYWTEGLVAEYTIREWNPMFGKLGYSAWKMELGIKKLQKKK